jgi:hypothetical protein
MKKLILILLLAFMQTAHSQWVECNTGLDSPSYVNNITISGNNIFAGTARGGVFRAKLSDFGITSVSDKKVISKDFIILPNPASEYIEILFPFVRGTVGVSNKNISFFKLPRPFGTPPSKKGKNWITHFHGNDRT